MTVFNRMLKHPRTGDMASLVCGLLVPFSFAPYHFSYLLFPVVALFIVFLNRVSVKQAFWRGWLFGFGQFVWAFSWIYHSVHTFGHAPALLAVTMIILLAAYCALFPALAALLARRFFASSAPMFLLAGLPLMWVLTEWLRGYLFTGFPWLALGVSQVDTPLAGYAPLFGALGTGGMVVLIAGLLVWAIQQSTQWRMVVPALLMIFLLGQLLLQIDWSEPLAGKPLRVSLAQLSVAQDQKWRAENREPTLRWYLEQTRQHKDSDLVIWPETAIPSFIYRVQPFWDQVKEEAKAAGNEVVAGVFMKNPDTGRYFNSLVSTNGDFYQKRHLVPLGEYMPFRRVFEFIRQYIQIPMSDIANGPDEQPLMSVAGYKAGTSICFEDVFDREIRSSLPEANLLLNVSNDAWFKQTAEPFQHHQIARMRSIETARYMVRSTNTGISAIIGAKGEEVVTSAMFERTTVSGDVVPMQGATPFVVLGNYPLILLSCGLLGWFWYRQRSGQ